MGQRNELQGVIDALEELKDDSTVQKNIKTRISDIIEALNKEEETSIKINKVLEELDEISNDNNLHSYTRTQIWNIASMLEMMQQ